SQPAGLFWDENGHLPCAQKYRNHIYFMELHPPLGKLLISLGEKVIHPNVANDQFINTDYTREVPPGFSFAGYRFFPALLSWWTAPLLFLIFYWVSHQHAYAAALSSLYMFDNALIVHCR